MPERSYPFDGGEGAAINEDQWTYLSRHWQDNGVEADGPQSSDLKVSSQAAPLALIVQPGHAWIDGFHYHLDEIKTVFFAENPESDPRIDRVVLRLDRALNTVTVTVKSGIASSTPVPPALDTSWETPELPLATFTVRAGANTVAPVDVVDTRPYMGRRIRVADNLDGFPAGTIGYRPTSDTWGLVKWDGSVARMGTKAEIDAVQAALNAHAAAADPHTQYMNAARGDARYARTEHRHQFAAQSFTPVSDSDYVTEYAVGNMRGGLAIVSFIFRRTASGTTNLAQRIGSLPANATPYAQQLLPAYVYSADHSTLTKAGAVRVLGNGEIQTYETFVGQNERILASGCYLVAPQSVQTSTEF